MNQYQVIKLRRLVHCMTKQDHGSTSNSDDDRTSASTWAQKKKIAMEQINLARVMLNEVKELFMVEQKQGFEDPVNGYYQSDLEKRNELMILQKLEISVDEACASLVEKYNISSDDGNDDLVNRLFFQEDDDDETEMSFDESEDGNNNQNLSDADEYHLSFSDDDDDENDNDNNDDDESNDPSQLKFTGDKKKLTVEELQRQQEEQLQNEIAEMAEQLKHATMSINKTLASGNDDLDNLASLAQSNVDRVKNANEEVTKHVKATGWRKSVGRWVIFFCVLSTWVVCFLTIRVVPRRKGACLFFCEEESTNRNKGGNHRGNSKYPKSEYRKHYEEYDEDYYGDDDDDDDDNYDYDNGDKSSSSQPKSSHRKVQPKYSFCEKNADNGNDCTAPDSLERYKRKIHDIDVRNDAYSQNYAQDVAAEMKEKRYLENLKKAEKEEDGIGRNRVREGWHKDGESKDDTKLTYTHKDAVNAVWHDAPLLVTILIEEPDLIDYADKNGWTILHEASRSGNVDSVVAILRHLEDESDVNIRTNAGTNAMWLAKHYKHDEIVQILAANGGVELSSTVEEDEDEDEDEDEEVEVEVEVEESVGEDDDYDDDYYDDVDEYDDDNDETIEDTQDGNEGEKEEQSETSSFTYRDAVHTALREGASSLLNTVLSQNPEFLRQSDTNGWTLLHEAVRAGEVENVSTILDFIDDVNYLNAKTNSGLNAMELAKSYNYHSIAELLAARGVKLSSESARGSEL